MNVEGIKGMKVIIVMVIIIIIVIIGMRDIMRKGIIWERILN